MQAKESVQRDEWIGGVNTTALGMLEQRAWGWFHEYSKLAGPDMEPRLVMNRNASGTQTGLAKAPYLRDTRRSIGLGGFRMIHAAQVAAPGRRQYGLPYNDTVALANYTSDSHMMCAAPSYMLGSTVTHAPETRNPWIRT